MADESILIKVNDVSKKYTLEHSRSRSDALRDILAEMFGGGRIPHTNEHHDIWALRNISLELKKGEGLGIIGHNGAGKSTLLKLLTGRFRPTQGTIETTAQMGAITQLGIGFNPELTGRQNILVGATMLGFSHKRALASMDEIIAFAGVGEFIEQPIKTYSSGMKARLGYAISAMMKPDVLLIDEVLAVGDMAFKRKCTRHINEFREAGGSILFVSHDLHAVQFVCDRVIVLERGRIVYEGNVFEGIKAYTQSVEQFNEDVVGAQVPVLSHSAGEELTDNSIAVQKTKKTTEQSLADSNQNNEQPPGNPDKLSSASGVSDVNWSSQFKLTRTTSTLSEETPLALTGLSIAAISSDKLKTGMPAKITLRYQSLIDLYPISWGFSFFTADGAIAIGTAIVGHHGTEMSFPKGEFEVSAVIAELPLLAGRYQLRVGVADPKDGVPFDEIGWKDSPLYFQVESANDIFAGMHSIIGDLVVLRATFETPRPSQGLDPVEEHRY
ncbi:ATP-binding cassette domain-containing protein [bacterium]|nr:ATP-binding cassette domain-containing protein [bacterium]